MSAATSFADDWETQYVAALGLDTAADAIVFEGILASLRSGLPQGWSQEMDDEYGYFYDHRTGESSWMHPDHDVFVKLVTLYMQFREQGDEEIFHEAVCESQANLVASAERWWGPYYIEDGTPYWYDAEEGVSVWKDHHAELSARHVLLSKLVATILKGTAMERGTVSRQRPKGRTHKKVEGLISKSNAVPQTEMCLMIPGSSRASSSQSASVTTPLNGLDVEELPRRNSKRIDSPGSSSSLSTCPSKGEIHKTNSKRKASTKTDVCSEVSCAQEAWLVEDLTMTMTLPHSPSMAERVSSLSVRREDAARSIQSAWRSALLRRRRQMIHKENIRRHKRGQQQALRIKSAIQIQSFWRGVAVRTSIHMLEAERKARRRIAENARRQKRHQQQALRISSAIQIQSFWRGIIARKIVHMLEVERKARRRMAENDLQREQAAQAIQIQVRYWAFQKSFRSRGLAAAEAEAKARVLAAAEAEAKARAVAAAEAEAKAKLGTRRVHVEQDIDVAIANPKVERETHRNAKQVIDIPTAEESQATAKCDSHLVKAKHGSTHHVDVENDVDIPSTAPPRLTAWQSSDTLGKDSIGGGLRSEESNKSESHISHTDACLIEPKWWEWESQVHRSSDPFLEGGHPKVKKEKAQSKSRRRREHVNVNDSNLDRNPREQNSSCQVGDSTRATSFGFSPGGTEVPLKDYERTERSGATGTNSPLSKAGLNCRLAPIVRHPVLPCKGSVQVTSCEASHDKEILPQSSYRKPNDTISTSSHGFARLQCSDSHLGMEGFGAPVASSILRAENMRIGNSPSDVCKDGSRCFELLQKTPDNSRPLHHRKENIISPGTPPNTPPQPQRMNTPPQPQRMRRTPLGGVGLLMSQSTPTLNSVP